MDREKIDKAAQLADDLKKVKKALGLYEGKATVNVRLSSTVGGGETEEPIFAYLPQSIAPAIYTVLVEAERYIIKQMEEL